ncbi:MAG TPA: pyridoxine 5'-phosphate synthase [Gemmatimonadaceae bacterium]
MRQRLYINIDHIATVRQARRGAEPVPVEAVEICERAGADGITAHLREDRRHIQDADIEAIVSAVTTAFNLEMACTPEMVAIAERIHPREVTLVPERREEVTTEGGLDVARSVKTLKPALARLRDAGIRTSLFIDPDPQSITLSRDVGADAIELHTGTYAHSPGEGPALEALRTGARLAASLGLAVHAGHGLTTANVGPVAAIPEVEELNIGHHVISRAIFVGLDAAVRELRAAMDAARLAP